MRGSYEYNGYNQTDWIDYIEGIGGVINEAGLVNLIKNLLDTDNYDAILEFIEDFKPSGLKANFLTPAGQQKIANLWYDQELFLPEEGGGIFGYAILNNQEYTVKAIIQTAIEDYLVFQVPELCFNAIVEKLTVLEDLPSNGYTEQQFEYMKSCIMNPEGQNYNRFIAARDAAQENSSDNSYEFNPFTDIVSQDTPPPDDTTEDSIDSTTEPASTRGRSVDTNHLLTKDEIANWLTPKGKFVKEVKDSDGNITTLDGKEQFYKIIRNIYKGNGINEIYQFVAGVITKSKADVEVAPGEVIERDVPNLSKEVEETLLGIFVDNKVFSPSKGCSILGRAYMDGYLEAIPSILFSIKDNDDQSEKLGFKYSINVRTKGGLPLLRQMILDDNLEDRSNQILGILEALKTLQNADLQNKEANALATVATTVTDTDSKSIKSWMLETKQALDIETKQALDIENKQALDIENNDRQERLDTLTQQHNTLTARIAALEEETRIRDALAMREELNLTTPTDDTDDAPTLADEIKAGAIARNDEILGIYKGLIDILGDPEAIMAYKPDKNSIFAKHLLIAIGIGLVIGSVTYFTTSTFLDELYIEDFELFDKTFEGFSPFATAEDQIYTAFAIGGIATIVTSIIIAIIERNENNKPKDF